MIRYQPLNKKKWITIHLKDVLDEGLRLTDLTKGAGMSDFTKRFKKERSAIMGAESKIAELILAEYNEKEDWVLFQFTTPATDKYKKGYKYKATNPKGDFAPASLPSKLYTMEIKVLKFFEWLDTTPGRVTVKDIEDVLKVADIQVYCDDISYQFQGPNFNMSMFDAAIYPTNIPPKHWDKYHNSDQFLCKHLSGVFASLSTFIPMMRKMFNDHIQKRVLDKKRKLKGVV